MKDEFIWNLTEFFSSVVRAQIANEYYRAVSVISRYQTRNNDLRNTLFKNAISLTQD